MIEVSNLSVRYGTHQILDIKNLQISTSKITALLGSNGSGKSTLIRCLSHLEKPTCGVIKIWGKERLRLNELRDISVLLPEPMLLKRSVRANFEFALKSRGNLDKFKAYVGEALALVGLDESFLVKKHYELSSGQTQRVAFALLLCLRSRLNLLDEPTNAVDIATARLFAKAIEYAKSQYKSGFIIASHDEKWLSAISEESVFLHQGRVSEFEIKNIFSAANGTVECGDGVRFVLPKTLKASSKVAINQNLINLSFTHINGYFGGILHSVSLIYTDKILIKIKVGSILLKCVKERKEFSQDRLITGDKIYFSIPNEAFLSLE
ncbi:energy-coupling factor ABC transporter ATP-binding protein [Campylobacter sp. faydin G-140]|uniref:tungstate ABC transporter ATP-binding protein TupC n=1 Tax=Campylobacter anatolicus TaxID=2829105 RepID=UPI001BA3D438|nr:tungstate ABC transporter ATP-binding protein TupC [Campylobacter anatolicus]MBR8465689.1 energy-coupling factor ABC transporter ATP-binding protein [Campylobacter anatolicus]